MAPRQMGVGMGTMNNRGGMGMGSMDMREDMNICGSMGGGMPMRMRDPGMGRMRRGSMDDVEGSIATMRKRKEYGQRRRLCWAHGDWWNGTYGYEGSADVRRKRLWRWLWWWILRLRGET